MSGSSAAKRTVGSKRPVLKRKSFFVDERTLRRAKRALGVSTDADVVRLSMERVAEMEEFWQLMSESRGVLKPGSIEEP
jgi:hypothetical protein